MKLTRLLSSARYVLAGLAAASFFYFCVFRPFWTVVVNHEVKVEFASSIWGALLLASFAGWGSGLNAVLFRHRRADWGLRCAWGWGVSVAIGGFLCALHLARRGTLFGIIAVGLLLLYLTFVDVCWRWAKGGTLLRRRRARLLAVDGPFYAAAAVICGLGALYAFGEIYNTDYNPNDDHLAYFQFAREILDRGTLTQPFSLRRISAYGGKSLLDAMQLAIDVPETHLHLLDKGLATLTILGLILGHARASRRSARSILLLAMLFVVVLPETGINTSAMRTAVVFFLGLYRTMVWAPVAEARGLRAAVPIAMLAAGACTLRQNYLVPIAAFFVLAYAPPILRSLRVRPPRVDGGALRDAAATAALLVAFLAPWWALSLRWCGTFLFPVLKGNYNSAYSFFPTHTRLEWFQYIWANASRFIPIKATPIFAIAALTMRDRTRRKPFSALVGAAFVGFAMLLYAYPGADPPNQGRYYFGFVVAAVLATTLASADLAQRWTAAGRRRAQQVACVPLVIFGLAVQLYDERERLSTLYKECLGRFADLHAWVRSTQDPTYVTLQLAVPAAATIATFVDNPSHFDHRRNMIECLDMIGAISPRPGIPLAEGGDAVATYLLELGYRYLIVGNPDAAASLYRRDTWVKKQKDAEEVWKKSAHFYLEAFDDFDELRRTRVHLAEAGDMTTLDLAKRKP